MTVLEKIVRKIVNEKPYAEIHIENIVAGRNVVALDLPHVVRTVVEALKDPHVVRPKYIRDITYDDVVSEDAKGVWNTVLNAILNEKPDA